MSRQQTWLENVDLGTLSELCSRQDCSLCSFVVRLFHRIDPSVFDLALPTNEAIYCEVRSGFSLPNESGIRHNWDLKIRFSELRGDIRMPIEHVSFTGVASDVESLEVEQAINLGQLLTPDRCDRTTLKSFYETCSMYHTDCDAAKVHFGEERLPLVSGELPKAFRLIDIAKRCVVQVPIDTRYAALSYVWGETNSVLLLNANEVAFGVSGALLRMHVPKTIADAIEVTQLLGEAYLRVDSLCIKQDSEDDKADQINRMGAVYTRAAVTIVAAGGTHADHGLPGWRPGSRKYKQIVSSFQGLRFMSTAPETHDVVSRSSWWTRAWTFQEYRLSRRLLIFTADVVYFHCQSSDFAEDRIRYLARGIDETAFLQEWQDLTSTLEFRGFDIQDYYAAVAGPYSRRQMKFESDGLAAISGVLQTISATVGFESDGLFAWGLPVTDLLRYGLLWLPIGPLRRRGVARDGDNFPSWSWVGWMGPVGVWAEQLDLGGELKYGSEVADDVETEAIAHWNFFESPKNRNQPSRQFKVLEIQAPCACLRTESRSWNQLVPFQDQEGAYTGLYKIFLGDVWVGSVLLDHNTNYYRVSQPENQFSYVALSRATEDQIWRSGDLESGTDLDVFNDAAEEIKTFKLDIGTDFSLYNVLLVEHVDDYAYRIGIGQIHPYAFRNNCSTMKTIKLA
jgi:hypothetical protein